MMYRRMFVAVLIVLLGTSDASAQNGDSPKPYAAAPFGMGERTTYQVKLGILGQVGNASFEVDTMLHTVRGHATYKLRMRINAGIAFAHIEEDFQSWLDARSLFARRFKQDQKEVKYERHRTLEFFPEERRWQQVDSEERGELPTAEPLDDLSFIYFLRTIPLQVGQTYSYHRYFKNEGNPVTVKVLRRQTISTPAGKFKTIVVQPIIKTKGLFSEGGKAEVFLTDDDRRIVVALKSKVKVLKSLDMYLDGYSPGRPPQ